MTDPARLLAAIAHEREGRPAEAEAAYRAALTDAPGDGFALFLLGSLLQRQHRAEAVAVLTRAVAARPGHQDSRLLLGQALAATDPAAAAQVFEGLPEHCGAQANLARLRLAAGDAAGGLAAIGLDNDGPDAALLRGTALSRLDRSAEALPHLRAAVAARPDHAEALVSLGGALTALDRFAEAEAVLRRAAALENPATAWRALGYLFEHAARPAEQIAALDVVLALEPGDVTARYNRALGRICAGDWARGFAEAECRRHPAVMRCGQPPPGPRWAGGGLAGKTILFCAEQGFGDTLMCLRYAATLRDRGARVIAQVPDGLAPLVRAMPEIAAVVASGASLPPYDVWIDALSLPHFCGTVPGAVPGAAGYLPRANVVPRGVGVVWAGNPAHANDARRSLPPAAVANLLRVPGRGFVSLQHGARAHDGEAFGVAAARPGDFAATAAAIAACETVIAVDTSVAHLAGAMGKRLLLMLPFKGEWRWGVAGGRTPWYASATLFRQTAPGDWDGVIDRVAAAL